MSRDFVQSFQVLKRGGTHPKIPGPHPPPSKIPGFGEAVMTFVSR